ncbi:MAG: FixH family protein [Candidatus Dactylopiibacterium sp.]|nr:FixH family protein [Candidatus Dactylopiibacterium sp.]
MPATAPFSTGAPWYRQFWPWLLISLPASAVIAGFATWYIAWASHDGLVAEDYYKQGLEINRSLESQELARQLGIDGVLTQAGDRLHLAITAQREIRFPDRLRLGVLSPVKAGADQQLVLERTADGYVVRLPALTPGHWNLALEDEGHTWKILASAIFPLQGEVRLHP